MCVLCGALAGLLLATHASAAPLFQPRPLPNAIAGPTDANVAAIFYNPAALGPLRGFHLYAEGDGSFNIGSERRDGNAGSTALDWTNFHGFVGLTTDLLTDTITVGLSTQAPLVDSSRFGNGAAAYQSIEETFVTYQQSVAAAIRLNSRFYFGASATFAESWMNYKYALDAAPRLGAAGVDRGNGLCGVGACGLENPLAKETLRLRGFGWGIGFSVGVLGRPVDRLWLALSYISHTFNTGRGVDLPLSSETQGRLAIPGGNVYRVSTSVSTAVPDIVMAAMRAELTPRVDLEVTARWVHYGTRSQLDVLVQGGQKGQVPAAFRPPPQFLLDQGLQDTFAIEASTRWRVKPSLLLSPSLVFETSAVESSAVSAAQLDAPKFDLALTAEWHPVRHLRLGAHAGVTTYVLGDIKSRFNSNDYVSCVEKGYDLNQPGCLAVTNGYANPTSSGHYQLVTPHAGVSVGLDY